MRVVNPVLHKTTACMIASSVMFCSEMAPPHLRGRFNQLYQLVLTFFILVAQVINFIINITGAVRWGWRFSLGFAFVPSFVLCMGGIFLPDSPNSLLERGKTKQVSTAHSLQCPHVQLYATCFKPMSHGLPHVQCLCRNACNIANFNCKSFAGCLNRLCHPMISCLQLVLHCHVCSPAVAVSLAVLLQVQVTINWPMHNHTRVCSGSCCTKRGCTCSGMQRFSPYMAFLHYRHCIKSLPTKNNK